MASIVEETLRSQRESWAKIADRVSSISNRELPYEPAKRILIFGLGSSHYAARLIAGSLLRDRSRPRIPVVACSSMSIGSDIMPQPGDWAIALTHRGTSKPTEAALQLAERAGAFTIAVSGEEARVLECARYTISTVPIEKIEPHTAGVLGAICAVTTLFLGTRAAEEWDALRSIGDPDLEHLRGRVGEGPTIMLGEWEGEWLAREGALKLMEMARLPVRVFGSEEYFHGPRFSRDPKKDRIWHIAVGGDQREPEIDSVHRVRISGGSPMGWVPALVELQWSALAVALNRGVDPDHPAVQ